MKVSRFVSAKGEGCGEPTGLRSGSRLDCNAVEWAGRASKRLDSELGVCQRGARVFVCQERIQPDDESQRVRFKSPSGG